MIFQDVLCMLSLLSSLSLSLSFNANKTKALLFASVKFINRIRSSQTIALHLNGIPINKSIEIANQMTNLGFTISSTLNWAEQVRGISNRVNDVLWRLKYRKNCLSTPLRIRLVSSLIFPLFDHCSAVFSDSFGQQKLKLRRHERLYTFHL